MLIHIQGPRSMASARAGHSLPCSFHATPDHVYTHTSSPFDRGLIRLVGVGVTFSLRHPHVPEMDGANVLAPLTQPRGANRQQKEVSGTPRDALE
jgi:hypothetical protein